MKILILGGYGVFGGRLAQLLADLADLELLIAGRSLDKAEAFCRANGHAGRLAPLQVERNGIDTQLASNIPDLLIDASGPFQEYGDDPYGVVRACLRHKVDYLDFADGSAFVSGINQFDALAKDVGIFVLSGVSSFPVLTAAVITEFSQQMRVRSVIGGIAPSPYAGVGMNVMRAVVGYAGGNVKLKRNGKFIDAKGLTESLRYTIAVPGRLPLQNLHFSLVDVPDLQVIPASFNDIRDIWMGAGPVPEFLHRVLNLLAKLRARFGLPSYLPLAPVFYQVLNLMKFGEHRGGMFIEVAGSSNQGEERRSWHLLAEGDDGPYIPSMAIELIVRKLIDGTRPENGARPAVSELSLSDYDRAFANRKIYTGFRCPSPAETSLFTQVLGDAFKKLPASLRAFHLAEHVDWRGKASVRAANNAIGRLIARIIGFPTHDETCDVHVRVEKTPIGEQWYRRIGDNEFQSALSLGCGREDHLLCESFGPITVALALVWQAEKLYLVPRRWRLWRLPLPSFLLPKGDSYECDDDGFFTFDVDIVAPIIGRLVAYRGKLRKT